VYIVPDAQNDAHDCPRGKRFCKDQEELIAADNWLAAELPPLLESPAFQRNGLLIIVWDESSPNDKRHGGGRIATVLMGPRIKREYRSKTFYQQASTLRLICDSLGLGQCPGAGRDAPRMGEFFQAPQAATR
jgi:acid phosphatase